MSFLSLPAQSIDDVIIKLTDIIEWAKIHESKMGYFPALYRKVTMKVQNQLQEEKFQNAALMERLDVIFANRYLQAFQQHQQQQMPPLAWQHTFLSCSQWRPITLHHLLLGMNAHINLDLGIAAAEIIDDNPSEAFEKDFFHITDILIHMIDHVQEELADILPALAFVDRIAGRKDESIAAHGMKISRRRAWKTALALSNLSGERRNHTIRKLDKNVSHLGEVLLLPGPWFGILLLLVRLSERRSVSETIEILE